MRITRRGAFIGVGGLVGASALSALSRGAVLPMAGNTWLKGVALATGRAPYLNINRVLYTPGYVTGVAWSQDGSRIAAIGSFGQWITVWDAKGSKLREFERSGNYIGSSIAFLSNDTVLTAATHRTAEEEHLAFTLWDIPSGSIVKSIEGPNPNERAGFNQPAHFVVSPDRRTVITEAGSAPIRLYSVPEWQQTATIPPDKFDYAQSIDISQDSRMLAVGSGNYGTVKIFKLSNLAEPIHVIRPYGKDTIGMYALAFSADGQFIATGSAIGFSQYSFMNPGNPKNPATGADMIYAPIKVWRIADGVQVGFYPGQLASVWQLAWSLDGRFLAAATGDGRIRLLSAPSLGEAGVSQSYASAMSVSFSPDNKLLAAATDSSVTLFLIPAT